MKFKTLFLALALASSGAAFAGPSATVTLTNNYVWRGISQSWDNPALQGEVRYDHESGFFASLWASNVRFGVGQDAAGRWTTDNGFEVDPSLGFIYGINDFASVEAWVVSYIYPKNEPFIKDYSEVHLGGTIKYFKLVADFSNKYAGIPGGDSLHVAGTATIPLPNEFSVPITYGWQKVDGDRLQLGDLSYRYFQVGVLKSYNGFDFSLNVSSTDGDEETFFGPERTVGTNWFFTAGRKFTFGD
jgi:uncharacterized protein (TIGR02001 family)